jgi:hypothetical protein
MPVASDDFPDCQTVIMASSLMVSITVVGSYFWSGYRENVWWSFDYLVSLLIPLGMMVMVSWFAFVPRLLEYDDRCIRIHFRMRDFREHSWSELRYYGGGFNVFLLQFGSRQALQILGQAYPKAEWDEFRRFLKDHLPERKASGWIGPFGFRWKWRSGRRKR